VLVDFLELLKIVIGERDGKTGSAANVAQSSTTHAQTQGKRT